MTPAQKRCHGTLHNPLVAEPIEQAGRAVACPLLVRNWQVLLLAVPLFCVQIDFSSISYYHIRQLLRGQSP